MPGRERGWVAVSVRTYHSHRLQQNQPQNQRVVQQDYTVDEAGATLNAVSRSSDMREEERIMAQMATASANQATTSIFIRDWKLSGRRAYIDTSVTTIPSGLTRLSTSIVRAAAHRASRATGVTSS